VIHICVNLGTVRSTVSHQPKDGLRGETLSPNIEYRRGTTVPEGRENIPPARPALLFAGHWYFATDKLALLAPIPWQLSLAPKGP